MLTDQQLAIGISLMSRVVVDLQLADQLGSRWNHRGKTWKFSMVKCWAMLDPQTPGSAKVNVAKTRFSPRLCIIPQVLKQCRNGAEIVDDS